MVLVSSWERIKPPTKLFSCRFFALFPCFLLAFSSSISYGLEGTPTSDTSFSEKNKQSRHTFNYSSTSILVTIPSTPRFIFQHQKNLNALNRRQVAKCLVYFADILPEGQGLPAPLLFFWVKFSNWVLTSPQKIGEEQKLVGFLC